MFGHQDTNDSTNQTGHTEPQADATLDAASPANATTNPDTAPAVEASEVDEALKALTANASADDDEPTPSVAAPSLIGSADEPAASAAVASTAAATVEEPRADAPVLSEGETGQLLDLKQSALQQLTPLIDQLDQTPEERFRTSMMMIQAADNQALLPTAYEAAQKITDEKVKAQALLDVVNEINYFTQQTQEA